MIFVLPRGAYHNILQRRCVLAYYLIINRSTSKERII
jgi:hypothetical protein